MCGSEPCVACRGPRRRDRRRASYLAAKLDTQPQAAIAVLDRPTTNSMATAIDDCRQHYARLAESSTAAAREGFLTAVRQVGQLIMTTTDPLIAQRIEDTGCARPTIAAADLDSARDALRRVQNEWVAVHTSVRRQHSVPTQDTVSDDLLFGDDVSAPVRRYRRAVHREFVERRAEFLTLSSLANGCDNGWHTRAQIRRDTYLEVLGAIRPIGVRHPVAADDAATRFPTAWIDAAMTASPATPTPNSGGLDAHHVLAHRVEDAVPAVAAVSTIYGCYRAGGHYLAVQALTGTGIDGRGETIAVGAEALFTGRFGGLIGDGYRTRDDDHRAIVLGTWAAM